LCGIEGSSLAQAHVGAEAADLQMRWVCQAEAADLQMRCVCRGEAEDLLMGVG